MDIYRVLVKMITKDDIVYLYWNINELNYRKSIEVDVFNNYDLKSKRGILLVETFYKQMIELKQTAILLTLELKIKYQEIE